MNRTFRAISVVVAALGGLAAVGVGVWVAPYEDWVLFDEVDGSPTPSLRCPTAARSAGDVTYGTGDHLLDAGPGGSPTQVVNYALPFLLPHTRQDAVPENTTKSGLLYNDDPPTVMVTIRDNDRRRIAVVLVDRSASTGRWRPGYTYECGTA